MPSWRVLLPRSIAARLYGGGLLAFLAVSFMAVAATTYADRTEKAADHFFDYGLSGAADAAELELLLEKHRRVIETAPVDLERMEANENDREARATIERIRSLLAEARHPGIAGLASDLPPLQEKGEQVLHLSRNYAQDSALRAVEEYTKLAEAFLVVVQRHKNDTLASAREDVQKITASSRRLARWIVAGAIVALLLIPLSLALVRSVVHRVHAITVAMLRLARNDTSVVVMSTRDLDEVGDMARAVRVFQRNAIELLEKQNAMRQLNAWLDIALNNMARGLSMFDADHCLLLCNRRFGEIYGIDGKVMLPGTPAKAIMDAYVHACRARREGDDIASLVDQWQSSLAQSLAEGRPANQLRVLADGRRVMVNFQPLPGGGWVDVHEDVTEKTAAEEKITRLAQIDTLTEVGNRRFFREQLEIRLSGITSTTGFAVHWIDLDRFKEVNDTLGHPAGDALLKEVAARLEAIIRRGDLVARLGGDEFAVIQVDVTAETEADAVSRRLLKAMSRPFEIMGQRISVGASIGVAMAPAHGRTTDELLKNADIALYRAKSGGRGQAVFFRPEHELAMKQRRQMELDLRRALSQGGLELHYQPIVCLETGNVISCEALMRWRHPERGMIPPGHFIPVAEECGLIVELGTWAIGQACRDAAAWPAPTRVAVNLSAVQFGSHDLAQVTQEALEEAGLAAGRLELEVTESLLLADDSRTLGILHRLRDRGISIALDDFGTGFASLSYLRSFPFDKIKIDQTFVRDLPQREDCSAIVQAVTGLARMLGIRTVAEGVETEQHLRLVRVAGCDAAQGYYFSRPVPARELTSVLRCCRERLQAAA